MCGLVGAVSTNMLTEVDLNWIRTATNHLKHRGPDDAGDWFSATTHSALGHRRLSVIDLSSGGHQPMTSTNGSHHLVFNGEIYNFEDLKAELLALGHDFLSTSDSEVLLKAYDQWGVGCLQHLNGQFAFAIVDEIRGEVILGRDRAGEKPLYYTQLNSGTFLFSSELKAMTDHSEILSVITGEDLSYFLSHGYLSTERTILKGIKRLAPAHYLRIDMSTGGAISKRYWSMPVLTRVPSDRTDLCVELEELLSTAIKRQYQADVPVGVLLSGGLDSSIIATLAARSHNDMNTFTAIFPESGELDESPYAKLISDSISSNHIELEVRKPSLELLEYLATNFDEPILDASLIPTYLLAQQVRRNCVVTLGGDGADELFGGYKHYSRTISMQKLHNTFPNPITRLTASIGQLIFPFGAPGNAWFRLLAVDSAHFDPQPDRMFDRNNAKSLFSGFSINDPATTLQTEEWVKHSDLVDSLLRQDFTNYLPNDILVKLDRYSMLASLEMRSPYLDKEIIEFAFSKVPSKLKVNEDNRKILLNDLGQKILPASFQFGRKMGFIPPIIQWGQTPEWRDFMKGVLLSPEQQIFDRKVLAGYFQRSAKRPLLVERLLTLTLFEIWRRTNSVKLDLTS